MMLRYRLVLAKGAEVRRLSEATVEVTGERGRASVDLGSGWIADVACDLRARDVSEMELRALAALHGFSSLDLTIDRGLGVLKALRALAYQVYCDRNLLATILPLTDMPFLDRQVSAALQPLGLLPDAFLQVHEDGLILRAPMANAEVIVARFYAKGFAADLFGPAGENVDPPQILLRHILAAAGYLGPAKSSAWAFHDLLFHSTSRGKTWGNFGGRRQPQTGTRLYPRLPGGTTVELSGAEGSFRYPDSTHSEVLARRSSRRRPGERPLSLAEFAAFLSLAAKPTARVGDPSRLHYPYPSGGGIYGYRVYAAARRCLGLAAGLYQYVAEHHLLKKTNASRDQVAGLAAHCGRALALKDELPDVVVIITADIGAFAAKYDAIAYRLALLGAGCLLQNMYLAASAIGLAGSAVGAGNPELFAAASGADPDSEPSVAEFALSGGTI